MDDLIRGLVLRFLRGETHMSFEEAVEDFPPDKINTYPPNVPYTPWQLLEHIRLTQADILNFMTKPDYNEVYKDMRWPEDYWPPKDKKADEKLWQETIKSYQSDLKKLEEIAQDPDTDFSQVIKWGDGQTMLEELLKVADHTSYHIGEFGILRQAMGTWPEKSEH